MARDWKAIVRDLTQPLALRMQGVFELRTDGGEEAVAALCDAVANKEGSTLFRHEAAFALGQTRSVLAREVLEKVLGDVEDDEIVRHEAGEALGAIGCEESIEVLEKFSVDEKKAVAETCELALESIRAQLEKGRDVVVSKMVDCVDPAVVGEGEDCKALGEVLRDEGKSLGERYGAMFRLRELNTDEAVMELCGCLMEAVDGKGRSSALLLHEIAYVLGQMQNAKSLETLRRVAADSGLHEMIRHEAVEAMSAIPIDEAGEAIKGFLEDDAEIVRESSEVALNTANYWSEF